MHGSLRSLLVMVSCHLCRWKSKRKYCVDLGGSNEIITKINALWLPDGHELVCLHTFELNKYFQEECHGELNLEQVHFSCRSACIATWIFILKLVKPSWTKWFRQEYFISLTERFYDPTCWRSTVEWKIFMIFNISWLRHHISLIYLMLIIFVMEQVFEKSVTKKW